MAFRRVLIMIILSQAVLILIAAIIMYFSNESLVNIIVSGSGLSVVLYGLLVTIGALLLVGLAYILFPSLKDMGTRIIEDGLRMFGKWQLVLLGVTAAIGEEILFRGALQPIIGIIPASILFGFVHMGWQKDMWPYSATAAAIGILLGLAYQYTGEIWVSIIGHGLYNMVAILHTAKVIEEG